MTKWIFSLFFLFEVLYGLTDYLTFIKNDTLYSQEIQEFKGESDIIYYDSTFKSNAVIKIKTVYNNLLPSLQLSCLVEELNLQSQVLDAHVYYESKDGKIKKDVKKYLNNEGVVEDQFLADKIFSISGNMKNGFVVTFIFKRWSRPLSGKFWCSIRNAKGTVESNRFEVQDIDYYQSHIDGRLYHKVLNNLTPESFPLTLQCSDEIQNEIPDYAKNIKKKIQWNICDSLNKEKCYSTKDPLKVSTYFDDFIDQNGNLVLLKMKETGLKNFGFWCSKDENTVYNYYTGPGQKGINYIDDGKKATFEAISPQDQTILIPEGQYDKPYTIYVKYRLGKVLSWSRDSGSLSNFPSNSYYYLEFPLKIEKNLEGIYYLGQNKEFRFDVKIVSNPKTLKESPSKICIMENQVATVTAKFENANSYSFKINGGELGTSNINSLNPFFEPGPTCKYTVKGFTGSEQSHTVSIIAKNEYESVKTNTLIRVFPIPEMKNILTDNQCIEDCLDTKEHSVTCNFDLEPYQELITEISWFVESMNLTNNEVNDERSKYLRTDKNILIVQPIGNDTRMRGILAKSDIYCRLRLIQPLPMGSYVAREVIFDSEPYKRSLKASFFPDEVLAKTLNSEMTWIASVVTAIGIILVIALLIVWYCTRNKGETYFVNAYEKAIGNDPEKEFRDVSAFQIYERPDTIPLHGGGPKQSFDDNDLEINSQDDFLECDYSDEIMTKFNETGSFINGLYGNRTIPKKNIDELTDSRNKNV